MVANKRHCYRFVRKIYNSHTISRFSPKMAKTQTLLLPRSPTCHVSSFWVGTLSKFLSCNKKIHKHYISTSGSPILMIFASDLVVFSHVCMLINCPHLLVGWMGGGVSTIQCATIMASHSIVNVRIIFYLNFSLSNTAKADNKCTISNDLVYISNAVNFTYTIPTFLTH